MPLSSIVVIVIRLFALNWILTSVLVLLSATAYRASDERHLFAVLIPYAPGGLLLIFAATLWFLASVVARFVSRGVDTTVNVGGLSRSNLYSFAFVFLGLYFVLSSIGDVINWIHYFAIVSHYDPTQNLYQLTRPGLTFIAGVASLLGAPCWTKKLAGLDQKGLEA